MGLTPHKGSWCAAQFREEVDTRSLVPANGRRRLEPLGFEDDHYSTDSEVGERRSRVLVAYKAGVVLLEGREPSRELDHSCQD